MLKRKVLRQLVLGTLLLVLLAGNSLGDKAKFDWRKYAGTKLNLLLPVHPGIDWLIPYIPEFEKLTGIKTEVDRIAGDYRTKLYTELTAGSSSEVDVLVTWPAIERTLFTDSGWVFPLNRYINDPALTNPDFEFNKDFFEFAQTDAKNKKGEIMMIPVWTEPTLYMYRKDLFKEAGLKPARTFDEFEKLAEKLHNPGRGIFGAVYRGQGRSAVALLGPWLWGYGADWYKSDGTPALDSPQAIKAIEQYTRILRKFGPPGVENLDVWGANDVFIQGRAAQFLEVSVVIPYINDVNKSLVVGKVGYALFPSGPKGNFIAANTAGFAISPYSKSQEAAWYFIQWATSKTMALKAQSVGLLTNRISVYKNKTFLSSLTEEDKEFMDLVFQALKKANPNVIPPNVRNVMQARDIIGQAIVSGIQGKDVAAALAQANKEFQELLVTERH